ncbi:MAG: cytochrome c oxidase assembly protein [Acidiferrobacterales bacterium]|nr:cytochrome c oxidase assembly protein [Acidiferrobacterales bacterium]
MSPRKREKAAGKANLPVLFLIPVLMFGFGYLMVPIYNVLCDITGLNGKTGTISVAEASSIEVDKNRLIKVEFSGSLNEYAPWEFKPTVTSMMVNPGKQYKTSYTATNKLQKQLVGQAVPSVSPGRAASHFNKTECFCFVEQTFEAGQTMDMPLVFIVDPDLPADVDTVTLSYTFFDVTKKI